MKEPEFQDEIQLVSTQVLDLILNTTTVFDKKITEKLNLNLKHGISYPKDNNKNYVITFDIEIFNVSQEFSLKVKYAALFQSKKEIDEDFKNSSFVQISSPAIAFPYVRSFISNLTINSGFSPVIFPSINFTKTK